MTAKKGFEKVFGGVPCYAGKAPHVVKGLI